MNSAQHSVLSQVYRVHNAACHKIALPCRMRRWAHCAGYRARYALCALSRTLVIGSIATLPSQPSLVATLRDCVAADFSFPLKFHCRDTEAELTMQHHYPDIKSPYCLTPCCDIKTRRDKWLESCPRAPTLPPPLHDVAIVLSLDFQSYVVKLDPGYP